MKGGQGEESWRDDNKRWIRDDVVGGGSQVLTTLKTKSQLIWDWPAGG